MALWKQLIVQKASKRKDISRLRKKRECGSDTFLLKADRGEGEQCSCAPQYLTLQYLKYLNICNIWDCNKNSITWELYISVWWCWWWMFLKEKSLKNSKEIYSGQKVEPSRVQSRWSPIGELALSLCHFHFDWNYENTTSIRASVYTLFRCPYRQGAF